VRVLADAKALAPGVQFRRAREILWALTSRDIYRMLMIERGWSLRPTKNGWRRF
jgi:hypothetical protein